MGTAFSEQVRRSGKKKIFRLLARTSRLLPHLWGARARLSIWQPTMLTNPHGLKDRQQLREMEEPAVSKSLAVKGFGLIESTVSDQISRRGGDFEERQRHEPRSAPDSTNASAFC